MLFWTTNAKRRLTRTEMLEVIVIEPGMKDLHDGDRISRDRGLDSLCGDLIRIDNEEYYHLVDSSLKDYLLRLPFTSPRLFEKYERRQAKCNGGDLSHLSTLLQISGSSDFNQTRSR